MSISLMSKREDIHCVVLAQTALVDLTPGLVAATLSKDRIQHLSTGEIADHFEHRGASNQPDSAVFV